MKTGPILKIRALAALALLACACCLAPSRGTVPEPSAACLAPALTGTSSVTQEPVVLARRNLDRQIGLILNAPAANPADNALYREAARQGIAILEAYARVSTLDGGTMCFLSDFGLGVLDTLRELSENPAANFRAFRDLLARVPTLQHPLGRSRDGRDVFVDVFPGMTPAQIRSLGFPYPDFNVQTGNPIMAHTLFLQLTSYCSNNCRTCAAQYKDKKRSPVRQMPYPLACKILRRFQAAGMPEGCEAFELVPYDANEVAEYADTVIGANANTLLAYADSLGYLETTTITHGTVNSPNRLSRPLGRTLVSVNILHTDVLRHVRDVMAFYARHPSSPLPEALAEADRALVAKYADHFAGVIRRELASGQFFGVRQMDPTEDLEQMDFLENPVDPADPFNDFSAAEHKACLRAVMFLVEVHRLQMNVFDALEKQLGVSFEALDKSRRLRYEKKGIIWIGRAAELLADLGVPPRAIAALQNIKQSNFQETDKIVVNSGGEICMVTNEDDDLLVNVPMRSVEELFGRPGTAGFREKEFVIFTRVLAVLLGGGSWTPPPERPAPQLQDYGPALNHYFTAFLREQGEIHPPERYRVKLALPGTNSNAYYDRLCRLFVEPVADQLLPLLAGPRNARDSRRIFDLVRTLPVPIIMNLSLTMDNDEDAGFEPFLFRFYPASSTIEFLKSYDLDDRNRLALQTVRDARNPLRPQREWYAPYTAFSHNPQFRGTPLEQAA